MELEKRYSSNQKQIYKDLQLLKQLYQNWTNALLLILQTLGNRVT